MCIFYLYLCYNNKSEFMGGVGNFMKQDKEILIPQIQSVLESVKLNKKHALQLDNYLAEHQIQRGTVNEIIINENALNELEPEVLCLINIGLYDITHEKEIVPELFWNESEIVASKRFIAEQEETMEYPIVIQNVIKLNNSDNDFVTAMSIQEINRLWKAGVLNYNYETQRTPKQHRNKSGSIIRRPDVNKVSVRKISELLLTKQYKADTITFNVLFDEYSEMYYDEKEKSLVLEKGKLDILDGFHRIEAINMALASNPDLEFYFNVAVKYYTVQDGQSYFGQINTINQVSKQRIQQLKNERFSDKIVNELDKKSDLNGRIAGKGRISDNQIINFIALSDAIDETFKPSDRKDFLDLVPYLTDFFGYLISSFKEEFVERFHETKLVSWINYPNVFAGYVVLAKKLYDSDSPNNFRRAIEAIKSIDFSKGSSPLNSILKTQGKENSTKIRKQLREFFEQVSI